MKKSEIILEEREVIFDATYPIMDKLADLQRKRIKHGRDCLTDEEEDLRWDLQEEYDKLNQMQKDLYKQYEVEIYEKEKEASDR